MAQRGQAISGITSAISHLTHVTGSCGLPEHLNRTLLEVVEVLTEVQSEISRMAAMTARLTEYRIFWENGNPATTITEEQRNALVVIAKRYGMTHNITISPMFGGDGVVLVDTGSGILGVEKDGHTHS